MKNAGKAMETVGKAAEIEKLPQTLAQFMKENEKMDLMEEMMGDAADAAFDTDGVDEDADEVMNQVLDEIGIDLSAELAKANAPRKQRVAASAPAATAEDTTAEEEELLRRLGALKN